jgi:hypothetical protein
MIPAALGFRAHSGWIALVAVKLEDRFPIPLFRERPRLVRTFSYEFRQPYHSAEKKPLGEAHEFVAQVRAEAEVLAVQAIQTAQSALQARGYDLRRCGVLAASARSLPELSRILASHALIHTADGELFREALLHGCRQQGLETLIVKEKDLLNRAGQVLNVPAAELAARLTAVGRALGSPWTQDEKFATLVACLALGIS